MEPIKTIIDIVDTLALVAIGVGVCRLKLSPVIRIEPAVTVTAPGVEVTVQPAVPAVVKIVMPSDIERVAMESGRVQVETRQPDCTWHHTGAFPIHSEDDQTHWPQRAFDELATEGRRLVMPSGRVIETIEELRAWKERETSSIPAGGS